MKYYTYDDSPSKRAKEAMHNRIHHSALCCRKKMQQINVIIGDLKFESIKEACEKLKISRHTLVKMKEKNELYNGHEIKFVKKKAPMINKVK